MDIFDLASLAGALRILVALLMIVGASWYLSRLHQRRARRASRSSRGSR